MSPRGLRNNNPGNIDFNANTKWVGQVGIETDLPAGVKPRFVKFSAMKYGVRAMVKLLQTYSKKYGADTIEEIVSRYAPSHENKTDKYIENVSKWSGINPTDKINTNDARVMEKLISAFIRQENGRSIEAETIKEGVALATSK